MQTDFLNIKSEIEKINSKIKEYLWKKRFLFKTRFK